MTRDELIAATAKLWVDEGLNPMDFISTRWRIFDEIERQTVAHDDLMRIERQIDKDQEELHA